MERGEKKENKVNSDLVVKRELPNERNTSEAEELGGGREISAGAAAVQLFCGFLFSVLPGSRKKQRLVLPQGFLPLLLLRFPGVLCWQE